MNMRAHFPHIALRLLACGSLPAASAWAQAKGPSVVVVPAAPLASPLSRDQFIAALTRDLAAHFNFEGELQLELTRPWSSPARLAAVWDVAVLEYPTVPSSSMLLRIRILADGQPVGSAADGGIVVRAALWRDAWSTRQPLTVGSPFDAGALEARRVDFLREREVLPASAGDRGFIMARAVPAGRMLTWRDITRRPLVKKGDIVEVSASTGLLVVTMKALAMESGAQGETVTVRNPESHKNFSAIVVDENRVKVRF